MWRYCYKYELYDALQTISEATRRNLLLPDRFTVLIVRCCISDMRPKPAVPTVLRDRRRVCVCNKDPMTPQTDSTVWLSEYEPHQPGNSGRASGARNAYPSSLLRISPAVRSNDVSNSCTDYSTEVVTQTTTDYMVAAEERFQPKMCSGAKCLNMSGKSALRSITFSPLYFDNSCSSVGAGVGHINPMFPTPVSSCLLRTNNRVT